MDDDLLGLLNKAYFYLKFRPRTVAETRRYLNKKIRTTHWSPEAVEKVIAHLIELELLDDKKFVVWFVGQRISGKPKGEYVLRQELKKYGIDKDLIDKYFAENSIDERELAQKTLSSRWARFQDFSPKVRQQKAYQFLLRRGFKYEVVKEVIKNTESL